MLQPPASDAPPGTPATPQTPTAVSLPGGQTIEIVGSPQQLQGLRERREMLREQLERATNRRSGLIDQLDSRGDRPISPEARQGIQQRLNLLDERILQIERDQALTERAISNAPSEVLAQAADERFARDNNSNDEDEAGFFFGGIAIGIMVTFAVARFRRWRRKRRGMRSDGVLPPRAEDDPRFERLSQTVDAMAEELERIGEGQRFVTQLLSKRQEAPALAVEAERP